MKKWVKTRAKKKQLLVGVLKDHLQSWFTSFIFSPFTPWRFQPTPELTLMTVLTSASELMKQGHRNMIFLSASFLMGKHENGPLTYEPRVTSLRQPSVAKKCGKREEERGREMILVSRQLSTSWINLNSNLAATAGNQSRKTNCWFLPSAGFYFWYTSQTKMSKSSIFSIRSSCGDCYSCQGVWHVLRTVPFTHVCHCHGWVKMLQVVLTAGTWEISASPGLKTNKLN